jgi:ATP-binding cassette, subfamily C, bacterial CydC
LLAVVATAAGLLGTGTLAAPAFVAVCLVAIAVVEPVVGLPGAVTALARARAASARLTELFPDATTPAAATHDLNTRLWPVAIKLQAQDIEVGLTAGDTVLLTGASGTGKSTILRAITGQPTPGVHARLAGLDAAGIDPEALAQRVTLVAQDAHVFDGTIRDNLQLADPSADDAVFWQALAAAALDDTVPPSPPHSTRPSAPAAQPSRAANAAASASRRASSDARTSCCSTNPPKPSTPPPPRASSPASERSTQAPRS